MLCISYISVMLVDYISQVTLWYCSGSYCITDYIIM